MYVDALGLVSASQAMGAGAVSTHSVDLGANVPQRQIGVGEPVGFGVCIVVSATVGDVEIEAISATDGALTTGIQVLGAVTIPLAEAVAGRGAFVAIAPGAKPGRYVGIRVTTAGGTVSVTAWLTAGKLFSVQQENYRKGYTIS